MNRLERLYTNRIVMLCCFCYIFSGCSNVTKIISNLTRQNATNKLNSQSTESIVVKQKAFKIYDLQSRQLLQELNSTETKSSRLMEIESYLSDQRLDYKEIYIKGYRQSPDSRYSNSKIENQQFDSLVNNLRTLIIEHENAQEDVRKYYVVNIERIIDGYKSNVAINKNFSKQMLFTSVVKTTKSPEILDLVFQEIEEIDSSSMNMVSLLIKNPNTSMKILQQIIDATVEQKPVHIITSYIIQSLKENPRLPNESLQRIKIYEKRHELEATKQANQANGAYLIKQSDIWSQYYSPKETTTDIIKKIWGKNDFMSCSTKHHILENGDVSSSDLDLLYDDFDQHGECDMMQSIKLKKNKVRHEKIRENSPFLKIAKHKNVSKKTLQKLANRAEAWIRAEVAKSTNIASEMLHKLAEDENRDVRQNVAANKNTSKETLLILRKDTDTDVAWKANLRLNLDFD